MTVFMPVGWRHQAVLGFLYVLVSSYVRRRELGEVSFAPFEMRLRDSAREPDLLFIARASLDRLTPMRLVGRADLVVELVSDDSTRRDRVEKLHEYAAAGVPQYWLVDPRPSKEDAAFYQLGPDGAYWPMPLDAEGRYHSTALPGFWLDPIWLR